MAQAKKEKFELEFLINSTPSVLFEFMSTPSGLAKWFCDDVNVKEGIYHFEWEEEIEEAKLLGKKNGEYVRFHWVDDEDDSAFFEWRIEIDPMTQELALMVVDFAFPDEKDAAIGLWESQIDHLMRMVGSK